MALVCIKIFLASHNHVVVCLKLKTLKCGFDTNCRFLQLASVQLTKEINIKAETKNYIYGRQYSLHSQKKAF